LNSSTSLGSASKFPLQGDELTAATSALVAEYASLREEIGRHQHHQKEIMQFGYAILPVAAVIAVAIVGQSPDRLRAYAYGLLVFPLIYGVLAALFTDRTFRLMWVGDYLHNHLRPRMSTIVGLNIWLWEDYRRRSRLFNRTAVTLLDRTRWLVFLGPSFGCILAFVIIAGRDIGLWLALWLVGDFFILVLSIWAMFFVNEAGGVPDRSDLRLQDLI